MYFVFLVGNTKLIYNDNVWLLPSSLLHVGSLKKSYLCINPTDVNIYRTYASLFFVFFLNRWVFNG